MQLHKPSKLWFPTNEPRPDKMYSGLMKYINDADFMLSLLPPKAKKRVCIQAGGHIGMWPLKLAPHFSKVLTFEPDPPVYEALQKNCEGEKKIVPYNAALGDHCGSLELSYYSGRTGVSTMAEIKNEGDLTAMVDVLTIDYTSINLDVAAIVLDIEGYEPKALAGAYSTIERCRPLIMCEMLAKSAQAITDTLAEMDYLPVNNPINRKCRDRVFAYKGVP